MTRTYAAVSNKGGAGKTTLVTLLAGEYAQSGDRGQHQSGRRKKLSFAPAKALKDTLNK
ncbi:hypothetical protein N8E89_27895 (plasmid) [Phyllobacterium sp. A18/5-2]|uniref:hypothetical protein n=1 Tax=Phyllobacterium sp. A18/5-2 TaxID=2978392 RepID=UPI0021C8392F|nr:hypothetical protein [Phyllobacterium sp. A18/5-2]UXN67371.1 hypothetical protein N8E89_27895 [Phyllobacterium sp. A18/5-2]